MLRIVKVLLSILGLGIGSGSLANTNAQNAGVPTISTMSYPELVRLFSGPGQNNVPITTLTNATRRLFEISYYEHHIPMDHRQGAIRLLPVLVDAAETAMAGNSAALEAYRQANQHMVDKIAIFGYGSLAWKLEEESIPSQGLVGYALRSENEGLLKNFSLAVGPEGWLQAKPALLKELVLSRRAQYGSNLVATLHGLTSQRNEAAVTILTEEEITVMVHAWENYQAARAILVRHGILPPPQQESLPLKPQPEIDFINTFVLLSAKLSDPDNIVAWRENSDLNAFYSSLNSDQIELVNLSLMVQRISVWQSIIRENYGPSISKEVERQTMKALSRSAASGIANWFKAFNYAKQEFDKGPASTNFDHILTYAFQVIAGVAKDLPAMNEQDVIFFNGMANMLNKDRVLSLDLFRFYLRHLAARRAGNPQLSSNNARILRQSYLNNRSSPSQLRLWFEDRIQN